MRIKIVRYANLLFRYAIAGLFVYFGVLAIINPEMQGSVWVRAEFRDIITQFIALEVFMRVFGVIQLGLAILLVSGRFLKIGLTLAAFLLVGIIVNLGFNNEIAYRDAVILTGVLYLLVEEW